MGVDSAGVEGQRLALRARRLGALIACKDSPFGIQCEQRRRRPRSANLERPSACPLYRSAGWQTALPTSGAGTANQGPTCFSAGIQMTLCPQNRQIRRSPICGRTVTTTGDRKSVISQDCKLPGDLQFAFTRRGCRDVPFSLTSVRICHFPRNRALLVFKVKQLKTSEKYI